MITPNYQDLWSTGRADLYKIVPLNEPTSIGIYPCRACNFYCEYCDVHSKAGVRKNKMEYCSIMSYETLQRTVDNVEEAGWHLKKLVFAGDGEPLLNPDIVKMIAYAKSKNCIGRTEIYTNASLLTQECSEQLIEAGLDQLHISVQGISAEQYYKIARIKIDFNKFIKQLEYFMSHKKHTRVYLKILDYLIPSEKEEEEFRNIYKDCADYIAVEHLFPAGELASHRTPGQTTMYGGKPNFSICPKAFMNLAIWQDGGIAPCACPNNHSFLYGNIHTHSLKEIWNSDLRKNFLIAQLNGVETIPFCCDCLQPKYACADSDRLDGHEEEIRHRLLQTGD